MYSAFFLILIFLFILIILLYIYPLKITGTFNSEEQPNFNLGFSWLNTIINGFVTRHNSRTTLIIYLFGRKLLDKSYLTENSLSKLREGSYMNYINILKALELSNTKLYSSYGFINPATTGVLCGAVNLISQYINLDEFHNNADFFTDESYFYINAETNVNVLVSIGRILRRKFHFSNVKTLAENR